MLQDLEREKSGSTLSIAIQMFTEMEQINLSRAYAIPCEGIVNKYSK